MNHFASSSDYILGAFDDLSGVSDEQLVEFVACGREDAFNELYKRFGVKIYNYLLYMLGDAASAEDALQEVFIGLWKGGRDFRSRSKARTWLYRIAYHRAVSVLRKRKNSISYDDLQDLISEQDLDTTADQFIQNDRLRAALASLPEKQKAVVLLSFVEEMSYPEIAQVLGVPTGTIKSRMSRALKLMGAALK